MWIKVKRESSKNYKQGLKYDLVKIDLLLDNGEGNSDILTNRMDVLKSLQDLDKLDSMEMAQKTRIKWAIEGDENSKYYYGVLNKKKPTCYPRRYWTLMENDVAEAVLYFFQYGQFPKAKILANRIVVVLGDIVTDVQSAFVAN
ncbi:hypothetical protein Tco_0022365, partial [Tanacetum coccineum]